MSAGERILLAHGGGGSLSRSLVEEVFLPAFDNPVLRTLDDGANLMDLEDAASPASGGPGPGAVVVTTDGYVVTPPFFPGGDIGRLAVAGTVNDLSVAGALPRYITCSFILEEGLPLEDLRRVVASMAATAREAEVLVAAGDTKVVERGAADRLFITTTGVGTLRSLPAGWGAPRPGDRILVNGTLGDHGFTILALRENLSFDHPLASDAAPLNGLVADLFAAGVEIRLMRDLTRGGLGGILNELADGRPWGFDLEEDAIPVKPAVRSFSELLGLEAMFTANEGKLVMVVSADHAERALSLMRRHPYGPDAAEIGRVTAEHPGLVVLRTPLGARRIVDTPRGDQLPRIC